MTDDEFRVAIFKELRAFHYAIAIGNKAKAHEASRRSLDLFISETIARHGELAIRELPAFMTKLRQVAAGNEGKPMPPPPASLFKDVR